MIFHLLQTHVLSDTILSKRQILTPIKTYNKLRVLDDWTSPFRKIIKNRVDQIVAEQKLTQKDELYLT